RHTRSYGDWSSDVCSSDLFAWPGVTRVMPLSRLVGNILLSWLTRLATGYGRLFDSQCGYTAANRHALGVVLGGPLFARYGYPNEDRKSGVEGKSVKRGGRW